MKELFYITYDCVWHFKKDEDSCRAFYPNYGFTSSIWYRNEMDILPIKPILMEKDFIEKLYGEQFFNQLMKGPK